MTITSGASGTGNGTVTITSAANTSGADRIGTVVVAGQSISIYQAETPQIFTDVPPSAYYFDAANLLSGEKVTAGCGTGLYCPTQNVTRAQMAIFIVRTAMGGGPNSDNFTYSPTPHFTDVPANAFGFQWIQKMYELGITAGCGTGIYCPNDTVTREQMAIFIIRARYGATAAFDFPPVPYFTDVPATEYSFDWVQRLREDNITAGCGGTTYCPDSPVIRGDMAIFLMRGGFNQLLPATEPVLTSVLPKILPAGQTATFNILGANTNFIQGVTNLAPIPGFTIGAVTVINATTLQAVLTAGSTLSIQPESVLVKTNSEEAVFPDAISIVAASATGPPTITSFNPQSGSTSTQVSIAGLNFVSGIQVTMPSLTGGSIALPLVSVAPTAVTVLIPSGAMTGPLTVAASNGSAATASPFSITAANTFSVSASPSAATLIQGQSIAYTVQLGSTNGFNQLAQLGVSGLPAGVTAVFTPPSITAGQIASLTLTASANQAISNANLSISASATVGGMMQNQSAQVTLAVTAQTTTLLGRTVVANPLQTPLAGVTVSTLGLDGNGNSTGCLSHSTVSDAAGNFMLTNLPLQCTGPQLMSFNGSTATNPPGVYASVNLVFTLVSGLVTASPVLVHLPAISTAETFYAQQNAATDQSYNFSSIPGLSVTAYAGTTFTMADGTQPNPFPLAAVQVPVDRLPDLKPNVPTMVRVFIVAFQPANTVASQPVAVSFPNVSNTPPGTDMPLMTLDPTHGTMVPYGTGAVSADGTQVIPDSDPAHPGHLYGLLHFDWHGQMPPGPNQSNPSPASNGPVSGEPVDLSSGLQTMKFTDIAIAGSRGSVAISHVYRTLTTNVGTFGLGNEIQYAWQLNTDSPSTAAAVNLISPDGNQYVFNLQPDFTFTNSSIPWLQGAVMTAGPEGAPPLLRFRDGTVYEFQNFRGVYFLGSITDRNGNVTTITLAGINPPRIAQITDPVGRSLTLTYNGNSTVSTVTDPIGRTVTYTYNPSGTLATMTDPNGGVTTYQYDSQNRMSAMIDARGVTMFQNTFDANGRVLTQTLPDGGVYQFAYTLANPLAPTSSVISTVVTDPLGNQTTYRFNVQGFTTDVTDALGQTKSFTLDPASNETLSVTGPAQCTVCGPASQGPMTYTYDGNGNMLTSTDALGNTTTFTYDPTFNQITSITDPLGNEATLTYDSNGNLITTTDQNGNVNSFTYDPTGLLLTSTDPLGNTTTIAYDTSGDPISVTDPLGNISTNNFDVLSRLLSATDPLGRTGSISYDLLNRVISTVDGRGSTTQFAYDPVGNLLTLTDSRGNATAFLYDSRDRVTTRTNPLGRTDLYQYDLDSNLTQHTDRRGQVANFQYDPLNRLEMESYQDGSVVARAYDPYSRLLTVNDSAGGVFNFTYDPNGNLTGQAEPTGLIVYTRDPLHRVSTRQVAGQSTVNYTYDAVGNLLGASMPSAGLTYSYDPRNIPITASRTNGVTTKTSYDPLGRVLSMIHSLGPNAINTQTYSYDQAGNLNAASNDISQPLITQPASETVDSANELLTNATTTYTYDANGNRLTDTSASGTLTYFWDSRNRLASITDSSGNVTAMHYDFARNLMEMDHTTGGATTAQRFLVDDVTNVVSLTDAAGLPVSLLTGRFIDSHYASTDSFGNTLFGITDTLNSTTFVANGAGAITMKLDFEPYGQVTGTSPVAYPFAYTGRVPVLGNVYYYRNRFYDAGAGRFISEDPTGFLAGSNLYVYSSGNPLAGGDPTGTGLIGAFVGGVFGALSGGVAASLQGGTSQQIFEGVLVGGLLGAAVGALDPTEGFLTLEASGDVELGTVFGAATGAYGDATTQILEMQRKARTKCPEPFNWGELIGATVGGGLGGGISASFGPEAGFIPSTIFGLIGRLSGKH